MPNEADGLPRYTAWHRIRLFSFCSLLPLSHRACGIYCICLIRETKGHREEEEEDLLLPPTYITKGRRGRSRTRKGAFFLGNEEEEEEEDNKAL